MLIAPVHTKTSIATTFNFIFREQHKHLKVNPHLCPTACFVLPQCKTLNKFTKHMSFLGSYNIEAIYGIPGQSDLLDVWFLNPITAPPSIDPLIYKLSSPGPRPEVRLSSLNPDLKMQFDCVVKGTKDEVGEKIVSLMDSGASHCFIDQFLAQLLKLPISFC